MTPGVRSFVCLVAKLWKDYNDKFQEMLIVGQGTNADVLDSVGTLTFDFPKIIGQVEVCALRVVFKLCLRLGMFLNVETMLN